MNRPHWESQRRYNYFVVYEMRDGSSGDFGTVATLDRKRDAEAVAAAMNYAYARGEANGLVEATESAAEEVNRTLHSLAEELDALASRLKR